MNLPTSTLAIPAVLARGGTSRGLIFKRTDLPQERELWDLIFLTALGSPDVRQLDGVGAGDSHTSKVAIVNRSVRSEFDMDFLFGEVAIDEARVDYAGNSGNIISALGPYALDEGWVKPTPPSTPVRIYNENTGKPIRLDVPSTQHGLDESALFQMPGVPGPGPRIDMQFPNPGGALTGQLMTGDGPRSMLTLDDGSVVEASLVDAANPVVFVDGSALGVSLQSTPQALNANTPLLARLQAIRSAAAVRFGLVERTQDAWTFSAMVPFLVLVFSAASYPNLSTPEHEVSQHEMDFAVRVLSLNMIHKSINVTVSVATTAAAMIEGTLVHELHRGAVANGQVRIGHPSGVTTTRGALTPGPSLGIDYVSLGRTARRIMQGQILIQPYRLKMAA